MSSALKNLNEDEILCKIRDYSWFSKYFDQNNLKILGKGAFGVVVSTKLLTNPSENIALKIVIPGKQDLLKDYIKEINFMTLLDNHANICAIEDSIIDSFEKTVVIRMNQAESSLKNLIDKEKKLPNEYILQLLMDVTNGLKYAHSKGIYHLDIKPANILIFKTKIREKLPKVQNTNVYYENLVFKLSDWGGGVFNTKGKTTLISDLFAATPGYMAPEISNNEEKLNLASCDIYSLGITLLICCGQKYENIKHISSISKEKSKKHDAEIKEVIDEIKDNYPLELMDLIQMMLIFDHIKRISLDSLIESLEKLGKLNAKNEVHYIKKQDQEGNLMTELASDVEKWFNYEIKTKVISGKLEMHFKNIEIEALNNENSDALFVLAVIYEGIIQIAGIKQNFQIALKLLTSSASKNNPFGLWRLGFYYLFGKGMQKNLDKGFYYLDLSARCTIHNRSGLNFRGYCFNNGIGVKQNLQKAFQDYIKALELGHEFPCWNLAILYENKKLPDESNLKYIEYYEMGMEKNDADCVEKLAKFYESGISPFEKNEKKSKELFETAKKLRIEYYDYNIDIMQ